MCTRADAPVYPTRRCSAGGIGREALEDTGAAAIYATPLEVRAHLEEFSQLLRL
jgi:hypothetical protein